jgi:outer membrane receptor protein involved in Fe transport
VLDDTRVGIFVQDSWQAGTDLLVDYGFRYDVSTFRLPGDTVVPSTIPNGGADRDWDNIAPRFGFTYTPGGGGLVIRGGAGIFYDKLALAFPAVAAITSGTRLGLVFPQGLTFEWNEDIIEQVIDLYGFDYFKEFMESGVLFPEDLVMRFSTGTSLDTPYTVQYTLGTELALSERAVVTANVVRSTGYHLPLMVDLNPVVGLDPPCLDDEGNPDPTDLSCTSIPVHRDDTTGSIASIVTAGRSWYTGLDLAYRWRGKDAWFSASYTWSKSMDTGPDPLKGGISLPPDSDNLSLEKGLSDFDVRHRLVVAGEMGLPWLGLRASTVIQFASGVPFNVTTGLDENYDGINTDRPEGVGRNTGEDTPLGPVNEIRRDEGLPEVASLRQPSFAQVDIRITKPFVAGRGERRAEAYVQVFNLLNRYNGGPVDGRVTSLYFGRPVGYAGPPRSVEAGLKFAF